MDELEWGNVGKLVEIMTKFKSKFKQIWVDFEATSLEEKHLIPKNINKGDIFW